MAYSAEAASAVEAGRAEQNRLVAEGDSADGGHPTVDTRKVSLFSPTFPNAGQVVPVSSGTYSNQSKSAGFSHLRPGPRAYIPK